MTLNHCAFNQLQQKPSPGSSSKNSGQAVVSDNRLGAVGNIGAQAVALAEPDGYTLLATPSVPMTINKYLYKDMSFEPTKLSSVIMMASVPNGIAARIDFPANNVKELIAYSQSNPGKVSFGSQGNSSTSHLKGQMFASMVGTAPTQQALVFDSVNETISPAIKQKLSWIETRIKITINKV